MEKLDDAPRLKLGGLHPKQSEAFHSLATEILFGGAAGPGKSHLMRVASIYWCSHIAGLQAYLFRRELGDLELNHLEGPKGYRTLLAPWTSTGWCRIVEGEIRFWNGSKIWLCHSKNPTDVYGYQGAEIHLLLIDELTQWLEFMYRFLRSRVRAPGLVVPPELAGRFPRILCSANPGGIGHQWVKTTFIDAREPFTMQRMGAAEGGMLRQFIPAVLEDNPTMAADDPDYENRLMGLGSDALVRAMRYGDWNIVAGAFFDNFRPNRHVLRPWTPPKTWTRFLSMDWGSAKPFSIGWWCIVEDDIDLEGTDGQPITVRRGALVRYKEWYGVQREKDGTVKPDVGLRLDLGDVADGIYERIRAADWEKVDFTQSVADPSMWKEEGGPSLMERLVSYRPKWWKPGMPVVLFQPADNTRITGWLQVRGRLGKVDEDPELFVCSNCTDWIRTVPVLQFDDKKPEDIDTASEDHAGDDTRYACNARPTSRVPKKRDSGPAPWSYDWIIKQDEEAKKRRQIVR